MSLQKSRIAPIGGPPLGARQSVRAMVVDRDSMSSQMLAEVLVRKLGYRAAAVSSSTLLQELIPGKVDLVLIGADLQSGEGRGFNLADAVYGRNPQVKIVMLLDRITRATVISAFRAGARGVFCRQQSMAELAECVEQVHKGMLWAGKTEIGFLIEALRTIPAPASPIAGNSASLTKRELQVVRHAAQGLTNKTIADRMELSEHTVKNYLFRAFKKLGVSSRIELLFYLTMKGGASADGIPHELDPKAAAPNGRL